MVKPEIKKQEKKIEKQEKKIDEQQEKIQIQKTKMRMMREQVKALQQHTKNQFVTLITAAFGFVAALFWRDAIKAFLEQVFNISVGDGGAWFHQIFIAIIITIFATVVIYLFSKFAQESK